ncbi:hypothetical protein DRF62_01065 [Chryseobacterium piscium]|uniref:Uncharacterized protein n=1 Tax=Chryseobacterium piscium TaxID=333702 RepID=A0A3D9BUI3_9FLAO|nr:hypothetical protein [Chryseobacterium piscium]REC57148.1 hypothetical protein DRF62_01065 [Chryseobacterium piscium]
MKIYLAVLRKDVDLKEFKMFLKDQKIELTDHYKVIGIVKLKSDKKLLEKDFEKFCESIEEEKDNFTI